MIGHQVGVAQIEVGVDGVEGTTANLLARQRSGQARP